MISSKPMRVCGKCRRINKSDMSRNWCPFRASNIHPGKPADTCIMFLDDPVGQNASDETKGGEGVREE